MLSLFPNILFLAPLAITVLRVVLGIYVFFVVKDVLAKRGAISHARLPLVGHAPEWMIVGSLSIFAGIGGLLIVGAWTQAAALIAAAGFLKLAVFSRIYPSFTSYPQSLYLLLCVVALTLVFTGAGALAIDLPL
jgi:uncharacterized membrane protein YphA (DoxX/SURF4 family)